MGEGITYAKAGVDVEKIKKSHRALAELFKETFKPREGKFGRVLTGIGHYAGLIDAGGGLAIALHADGVGTKTLIARALRKYDTVGVDCVAMNANDLICVGAEPVALVDYLAMDSYDEELIVGVARGLAEGAKQAGMAVVGGETAVMPDLMNGFDLSAMSIGVVEKSRIVSGEAIKPGDAVLGLESSGIHSNGLTLARKVLLESYGLESRAPGLKSTLGEELLKPTRIYVGPVLEVLRECRVHGLAHVTGGAFSKLTRLKEGVGFKLDSMPEPPPIFKLIQRLGRVTDREMYRTFNMGVGFCIVAPRDEAQRIKEICEDRGVACRRIGEVVEEPGVFVKGLKVA